jgi:hypothetical protein
MRTLLLLACLSLPACLHVDQRALVRTAAVAYDCDVTRTHVVARLAEGVYQLDVCGERHNYGASPYGNGQMSYAEIIGGPYASPGSIGDQVRRGELPPPSSGGRVQVRGYTRRDGTYVRPHTRSRPH